MAASISKNIHFIRHIRCPVPYMRASREPSSYSLTQGYRLIPSDIISHLQYIAETCNRLIRPLPSCRSFVLSHYLRVAYNFASATSSENHTRFTSHPLLYPTRSPTYLPPRSPSWALNTLSVSLSPN